MKKIVTFSMVLIILFSMTTSSFATISNKSQTSIQEVKEELKSRGIEYLYVGGEEKIEYNKNNKQNRLDENKFIDNSKSAITFKEKSEQDYIKVASYEELEELINEIEMFNDSQGTYLDENQSIKSKAYKKGTAKVSKWSPLFGTFAFKTVFFDFEYSYYDLAGEYIYKSVNDNYIDSSISGISAVDWIHRSAASNISSDGRSVTIHVSGEYVLGVEINDFPVGIPIPGDWKIKSKGPEKYNI